MEKKLEKKEIFERLNHLLQEYFDDDSIHVTDTTTADEIEYWDSFEHINLMFAVEEEFEFKMPMRSVLGMKNVGELVDIIQENGR